MIRTKRNKKSKQKTYDECISILSYSCSAPFSWATIKFVQAYRRRCYPSDKRNDNHRQWFAQCRSHTDRIFRIESNTEVNQTYSIHLSCLQYELFCESNYAVCYFSVFRHTELSFLFAQPNL